MQSDTCIQLRSQSLKNEMVVKLPIVDVIGKEDSLIRPG